jgi:hypothetical protein
MSDLQIIESALRTAARRRRWAKALWGFWIGLLVGALASLVVLGVYHVAPLPLWTLPLAAVLPVASMLLGLMIGGWRSPKLDEVARWIDDRQKLKERLSTALEVAAEPKAGAWRDLVLTDAASHVRDLDARQILPFHLSHAGRWAAVVLALAAGLGFVPEYRSKEARKKRADHQNIQQTGKRLADLTKRTLETRPSALEPTQKSLEAVAALGDQLAKKATTRTEALKNLSSVADKLKDQLKELGKDPALRKLEQAARGAAGSESRTAEGMQKQMEALQKQLGAVEGKPEAIDQLKKDLEKLQQAAKGLTDKNSPMDDTQRQKLSDSLSALSKQAQDMGLQLPQLDEAIASLAANQTELFLKDLQASVNDLEKMREMAQSLQRLQQHMEKLGKDLAEQLQNGQAEAAQSTLEKMSKELQAANLNQEQLQKMLQEVSEAVDPASKYGKVGDFLKDAARQMKSGEKQAASQSLASAAKELEKLMQNLGDAQELAATLEAMNQAAQSIASGRGWRPGSGRRPGQGDSPNGQPGSGVGTWADGSGTWDGQSTAGWDNSGIVRPDQDGRSGREEPDALSEALKPTKVKGQVSPGGQMPSITLKGVSIKGQSRVAYEEAVTAAQVDAQSALSQEKVPRAYQRAVKDYFDDLKK